MLVQVIALDDWSEEVHVDKVDLDKDLLNALPNPLLVICNLGNPLVEVKMVDKKQPDSSSNNAADKIPTDHKLPKHKENESENNELKLESASAKESQESKTKMADNAVVKEDDNSAADNKQILNLDFITVMS